MEHYDVICIGGGPAGLTAAYHLGKHGRRVLVLEKNPEYVGGISRTVNRDGYRMDIGGHRFFSKSPEINALWQEVLSEEFLKRPRKSRILYQGKLYPYPLAIVQTLRNLGLIESARCMFSYLRARLLPVREPKNFEQWVSNRFGHRLYGIFFKTYTEKVWGMPCEEISADWAAQRIKGLSLSKALSRALTPKRLRGRNIKTLIEEFHYPRLGPGMMWEAAMAKIHAHGNTVRLGAEVVRLENTPSGMRVTWKDTSNVTHTVEAGQVISSAPLRELAAMLDGAPSSLHEAASALRYRDFMLVALVLNNARVIDDNWIYVHDPAVKVGRIQNFKAWSPCMVPHADKMCYGMEYFCFEGDQLWSLPDEELIRLASRELVAVKLAAAESDIERGYVIREPKAYPVYDSEYTAHVGVIRRVLESQYPALQVVGRNGMHKYNNQDHSMMTALLAAENILQGARVHDVWAVNEDAVYHEHHVTSGAGGMRLVPLPA